MVRFPPVASGYFFTEATDNGIPVYASRMNICFTKLWHFKDPTTLHKGCILLYSFPLNALCI